YLVACRCHECEVIRIAADRVRVEKGRRYPHRVWDFNRVWTQVVVERCPDGWYPSRLLIRSQGRVVEIGRFLSEPERERLATELVRVL
ncbi:MAG: DUF2244 domain-containing protein, partial [Candidatus Competibacteraceae bacterium]|nr:DUF2244 domain-containing protein [Candidatus Competibacteraceae bacterium]